MSTRSCLFALLALVAAAAPVPAFALSEGLTKTEIACQNATNGALSGYTKARTGCIAACEKKTPLAADCAPPFANKALECVQKANAKLATLLAKKCLDGASDDDSCPECYKQLSGSCSAFGTAATTKSTALSDDVTNTIFCDDSASPDGLTKAEAKCQKTLLKGITAFVSGAGKCATSCLKAERKGKTDGTCNPAAFLFLNGDTKTVNCLFKTYAKMLIATTKCQAPAGDAPECLTDIFGLTERVKDGLSDVGGDTSVCPAQCGDGYKQGLEACDPPNSVGVCAGSAACTAQCTCP